MVDRKSLLNGGALEYEIFGVGGAGDLADDEFPPYLSSNESIQKIVGGVLSRFKPNGKGEVEVYNPAYPIWGLTKELWRAVRRFLPRRLQGEVRPLCLYIAVGWTSLDIYHGIDAFFWWQGAKVTLDVSMIPKIRIPILEKGESELKADILVLPEDMSPERLRLLGKKIATLLKERSHNPRQKMGKKENAERNHILVEDD